MEESCKYFSNLADCILKHGAYKATKIISDKLTVKATRKRFGGKVRKGDRLVEIVFTVGRPNYQEREFIKLCKKAKAVIRTGECTPYTNVILESGVIF